MDCEFGSTRAAGSSRRARPYPQVNITTRDKVAVSLRLTATGASTHASRPMPRARITHLVKALARLADWDPDPTLKTRRPAPISPRWPSGASPELAAR